MFEVLERYAKREKNSKEGYLPKDCVEPESMPGLPSVSAAAENGRNDDSEYSSGLVKR